MQKLEPLVKKQFFEWSQISSIAIVAFDNQLTEISDFLTTCAQQNINTEVFIIYNGKLLNAPVPSYKHLLLTKKQFSFFNIPTANALHPVCNITYDVLINLGANEQLQTLATSKLIKAKCKIASYNNNLFDISIKNENNTKEFLKQIIVYLQMIKNH